MAAETIPVSVASPGHGFGSARGLKCGRVMDPARTVEPAKHMAVPVIDLGESVNPAGLVEPAPLVETRFKVMMIEENTTKKVNL